MFLQLLKMVFYYIEKGLDLTNVAPLDDYWLKNILEMVPCHLKSLNAPLELLVDEINEEYLSSIRTAIGMYSIIFKVISC